MFSGHCSVLITATFLQSLGADECVDYKKDRFEELYANDPFDVVLDLVGGELCGAAVELVSTLLVVPSEAGLQGNLLHAQVLPSSP